MAAESPSAAGSCRRGWRRGASHGEQNGPLLAAGRCRVAAGSDVLAMALARCFPQPSKALGNRPKRAVGDSPQPGVGPLFSAHRHDESGSGPGGSTGHGLLGPSGSPAAPADSSRIDVPPRESSLPTVHLPPAGRKSAGPPQPTRLLEIQAGRLAPDRFEQIEQGAADVFGWPAGLKTAASWLPSSSWGQSLDLEMGRPTIAKASF